MSRNDKGLGAQRAACRTEGVDSYCPQRGRHPTTAGTRLAFRGRRHRSEGALGALPCLRGGGTKLGPVSQSLADLQRTHTHSFSRAAGRLSQGQGQALERGPKARSEHCLWFALQPRDNDFASLSTAPSIRKPLKAPRPHGNTSRRGGRRSSVQFSRSVVSDSLRTHGLQHIGFLSHHQLLELA